jgi:phage-related protein
VAEIEFYRDARGRRPVLEYIEDVRASRPAEAASIARYINLLDEHGSRLQMPFVALIDSRLRIFELRPGAHRVAFARHLGRYVLLHAWRKRTQRLDPREIALARSRLSDWKAK